MTDIVPAHEGVISHRYHVHYPAHAPRESDPHYRAFEAFRKTLQGTDRWVCHVGRHLEDFSRCDRENPLELHHAGRRAFPRGFSRSPLRLAFKPATPYPT